MVVDQLGAIAISSVRDYSNSGVAAKTFISTLTYCRIRLIKIGLLLEGPIILYSNVKVTRLTRLVMRTTYTT